MREDDLASVELSKLAIKYGFDEPCVWLHTASGMGRVRAVSGVEYEGYRPSEMKGEALMRPYLVDIQRWLREDRNIDVIVDKVLYQGKWYYKYVVFFSDVHEDFYPSLDESYNGALEKGLDAVFDEYEIAGVVAKF